MASASFAPQVDGVAQALAELGQVPDPAVVPAIDMARGAAHVALLAAVIVNALLIPLLIPLALRGVAWRPASASQVLGRNLLIYGLGGLIAPFPLIWAVDRLVVLAHLA